MQFPIHSIAAVLLLMPASVLGFSEHLTDDTTPLRISEPVENIVRDLQKYVPEYMERENIPGVAVALVRDSKIVWMSGFGLTNTITRERVNGDTLFEVASNSKVMTAYIALLLVDQGILSLDKPLNDYLSEPWLPASDYRDIITLRHILSHSSGLGHNSLSRENLFPPGNGYSYSGTGFIYLQRVIEEVTGRSLETLAREMLFQPLEMDSSSYINQDDQLMSRTAAGHLWAAVPALFFVSLYLIALLFVGLIGFPLLRFFTGKWRPTKSRLIAFSLIALLLSILPPFILLRPIGLTEFAWCILLCGLGLTAILVLLFLIGRLVILRYLASHRTTQIALTTIWILTSCLLLGFMLNNIRNLPVPGWTPVPAGAASSVRATAHDMAAFLIELSNPSLLDPETAQQLQTPQIRLRNDLSWGLGPGIQHSPEGNALWQWGQHIDFQSVMIIYPSHGFGVVVLTNSDLLNPDVAVRMAHRAIGGKIDAILLGSHTVFNYPPDN